MIIELIRDQVTARPDHPAVLTRDGLLGYGELWHRAGRVASRLWQLGVRPGETVGLFAQPSLDGIVGLLAILRTGGVYVPLCPSQPAARTATVVADSATRVVLCGRDVPAGALPPVTPVWIHTETTAGQEAPAPPAPHPEAPLALVYTSGTTGTPKGVLIPQRAMRNRLDWGQGVYPLQPSDRVLHHTRYIYDFSAWEVLAALGHGATLAVERFRNYPDYDEIITAVQDMRVTIAHFVPSVLSGLVRQPAFRGCRSLRTVFAGGEALPGKVAAALRAASEAALYNQYGPTETCIDSSFHRYTGENATTVPIGRAIDRTRLHVLDERLAPVPAGTTGELYIGGDGLATAYAGRSRLTAARFVADPFAGGGERMYRTGDLVRDLGDGVLEFAGRADLQVSLRGVRLELSEVEHVLETHPRVDRAIAVVVGDERPHLVAWLLTADGADVDREELRALARSVLPPAAVPDRFHAGDSLPLLPTGKIDRAAVRRAVTEVTEDRPAGAAAEPVDPAHDRLAAIWREVLGVDEIGPHDDFFDLGGHSLLAVELVGVINERLGTEVPLAGFFEAPTVKSVAELIEQEGRAPQWAR